ncbi:antitoxin VbhA family protein [Bradyrhizobium sp.]
MNVISPKKTTAKISVEEMERRRKALSRADAHNRIEGIFPNPKSTAIYEEYIRGEIEMQDIWPRIEALKLRS